jgi:alkylation response protein AidB-like acyl-CoA dehydrogenase
LTSFAAGSENGRAKGLKMIDSVRSLTTATSTGDDHDGAWPGAATAAAFAALVDSGRLNLPLPGGGRTRERWAFLANLAGEDLSLARLAEGHADALAILAELGVLASPPAGSRWGVWAAQPPGPGLMASRTGGGWRLDGTKLYCSGARSLSHALVTATAPDGNRLFAISTEGLVPTPDSWQATGMAASDTLDVEFTDVPAEPVGGPGGYTSRPGFAHGGAGVAACWFGGARGVGQTLLAAAGGRDVGPHALAHLGAVDIALRTARSALDAAAAEIDADPDDLEGGGWLRALRVRSLVESVATEVMDRVGRALGAGPLSHDEAHSRRVADLTVYLRQHHAERDLAELGALVADRGTTW